MPSNNYKQDELIPYTKSEKWRPTVIGWLAHLSSENTRRTYLRAWIDFMTFAEASPDGVINEHVESWLHSLEIDGQKPITITARRIAIKSYFDYLIGVKIRDDNPAARPPESGAEMILPEMEVAKSPLTIGRAISMSEMLAKRAN